MNDASRPSLAATAFALTAAALTVVLVVGKPANANPPDERVPLPPAARSPLSPAAPVKDVDRPDLREYRRLQQRRFATRLDDSLRLRGQATVPLSVPAEETAKSGTDRVLVILVEFAGSDTFTWTAGQSQWDPLGKVDDDEIVRDDDGDVIVGDCSKIITATQQFTYQGPLHNAIARPLSAADRSGDMIWTEDFSPQFYRDIAFGNGVKFQYARQDASQIDEDYTGYSVRTYYDDLSGGRYTIAGDVYGWVQVPHSVWWYGADTCPGRRTAGLSSIASHGAIPGAGSARTLVTDALAAVETAYPTLDWDQYDGDGDGIIDRLWIIHSGFGEEDSTTLLDRTDYGESALWSHSASLSPAVEIAPGVWAGPYIMMPENSGIAVLAHEYGHSLGAIDLYAYGAGETSAGFWTLMADDWTGYPIGYMPPAVDPWHLDGWGWLDPVVVSDPNRPVTVTLGQASEFPGGVGVFRGVKIRLPDKEATLPVQPTGSFQWWGGRTSLVESSMRTATAISVPASGATLSFSAAWDLESGFDFLWVLASGDGGTSWRALTNNHTSCTHGTGWIGGWWGFPEDLCGGNFGGLTGRSAAYPSYQTETFDLSGFAGQNVLLWFLYMTDWNTLGQGPFLDDIAVRAGSTTLLADDAESASGAFRYVGPWLRTESMAFTAQNYYLQWRNVSSSGGFDLALADSRWRYGPANSGLLVWYNDERYIDNEVWDHKLDAPGFGPKGRMLVVDAHPEPYRSPALVAQGYANEGANLSHRSQMRDATFSLSDAVDFTYNGESFDGPQAVSVFDDANGYYPGAEYVSRGPGYSPAVNIWATRHWDSSVTPPTRGLLGIRAPGYTANDEFRFRCSPADNGLLSCYWLGSGTGLGYDGGSGNPGDVGMANGWRVEIVQQTDGMGTVAISNQSPPCALVCDADVPGSSLAGSELPFLADIVTGSCTAPLTVEWEFGDGSSTATTVFARHAYSASGSYRWTMGASSGGASCQRVGTVDVTSGTPSAYRYLVPSVAHLPGKLATQWRTNVAVVNRSAAHAQLTLTFLLYEKGGTPLTRTVTLAAGESREWEDIMVSLFSYGAGASVKGTLDISSDMPLSITSRTFNQTPTGTYGQYYPALAVGDGLVYAEEGVLPQLRRTPSFRTNVGLVNVGSVDAKVRLRGYDATGARVGKDVTRTVTAGRYWQADDVLGPSWLAAGDLSLAYVTVEGETSGGRVWAYAAVVDNTTGDPTTIPLQRHLPDGVHMIPSVAHLPGKLGTQWRTNVAVVNRSERRGQLALTFYLYEKGGTPLTRTVTLEAGESREWEDILVSLFSYGSGASVKGTLEVAADVPMVLTSRTFNQTTNGTYGQYYPALTAGEVFVSGQEAVLPQLRRSTTFRTNVGLVNVGAVDAKVRLRGYDASGTRAGRDVTRTVTAGRYWQFDDVFGPSWLAAGDLALGYVTVEVETNGGRVWTYAAVVDNTTGDPTTLPGLAR